VALSIPIVGVGADFKVPGSYAEIRFNQGSASASAPGREVCFVMPMTSAGAWIANTLYRVTNEGVASAGAGPGSPLHRGLRKFLRHNPDAKVSAVPYAASSGGAPASATTTVVFSGTLTAGGTVDAIIAGEHCPFGFKSTDTMTQIGDFMVAAVNAKTHLPVTAANVTGTVTLTAKIAGASQGTASIFAINVHAEVEPLGTGLVATVLGQLGAGTAGADGTTTEAANFATALAVLDSTRKYYVVTSLTDATSLGNLKTHIVNKSLPRSGLRSVGIAANRQALSAAQTIAIGRNYERLAIAWMKNSEHDPAELAAAHAAIYQQQEAIHTATNFDFWPLNDIILPHYASADRPTADDLSDAINDGLSPVQSNETSIWMVMACTTRSKDATGALDDPRSLERHRVSVADEFTDEELAEFSLNYRNKRLADDELLANGKFNPNQREVPNVVRPSAFKPHIVRRLRDFQSLGKLQKVDASVASLRVVKTGARLEVGLDLNAIDLLHQASYLFSEVSEG
jgi:phage tail sheath gpL-like